MATEQTTLPKYIIARRTFTYNVEEIINSIRDMENNPTLEVSEEDVWDYVESWVYDDMRSPATRHDISWVDENGNEL